MRLALLFLALASCAAAGEYVVLTSGFRLRIDRHEQAGDAVRLFTNGGVMELPAASIVEYEAEEAVPVPPAPPAPAAGPAVKPPASPKELIERAAERHGLPAGFVRSVALVESGLRQNAISPKGAVGLMQLMPGTAASLGADPNDPEQNVEAGVRYLRDLLLKYKDDDWQVRKALAAYNAGPGAVDRYKGVPPYRETQTYVEKVLRNYRLTKPK